MGRVRLNSAYEVRAKLQSLLFATKAREDIADLLRAVGTAFSIGVRRPL
jgi:hypothetical protein